MAEEPRKASPVLTSDVSALVDPSVPKMYMNGFTLGLTNADAQIVLKLYGRPVAILSFSYTLAKTLSRSLARLVSQWETKTGHTLATTEDIDKAFVMQTANKAPETIPKP